MSSEMHQRGNPALYIASFINCAILYGFFETHSHLKRPRNEFVGQHSEAVANPLDFCCDVWLKLKRAVPDPLLRGQILRNVLEENFNLISEEDKIAVGKEFWLSDLETEYAQLFYKVKNACDRARMKIVGEESDGETVAAAPDRMLDDESDEISAILALSDGDDANFDDVV